MSTWRDRVQAEHQELESKLDRLHRFLADDSNLRTLSPKSIALLIAQSYAMTQYRDILECRLRLDE